MTLYSINQLKNLCKEFNVTEETFQKDIETLMEWLKQQPHLPSVTDEDFLRLFFLRCKAELDKTKKMLEKYYIYKGEFPEVFRNRDFDSAGFTKCFDLIMIYCAPRIIENEIGLLIIRIKDDVSEDGLPSSTEFLKYIIINMLAHTLMSPCRKFILIGDYRNAATPFIKWLLKLLKRILNSAMKIIPIRVEKVIMLHTCFISVLGFILVARRFSKTVFEDRLIIWDKDVKELGEEMSVLKDILPFEYGGTGGQFITLAEQSLERMKFWKQWLNEEERYVSDLSKRPIDQGNSDTSSEPSAESSSSRKTVRFNLNI